MDYKCPKCGSQARPIGFISSSNKVRIECNACRYDWNIDALDSNTTENKCSENLDLLQE